MKRWFGDNVAWITGGGSGIGRATALAFAKHGCNVAVSGRRADRLQGVVDELKGAGVQAIAIGCDVADEEQVAAAAKQVVERFGKLDVVLANAGFSVAGKVVDLGAEDWKRQLDVNVVGVAVTARHTIPHLMVTNGRFGIIGSVAAFICAPKLAAYSASKHAVRALGHTLSIELEGTGVSCTLIHPGYVDSEIAQVDNAGHFDPERKDRRPKNMMWPAERAADVIVRSLYKRKREVVFSNHGKVGAFIGQHLPGVAHLMMSRGVV